MTLVQLAAAFSPALLATLVIVIAQWRHAERLLRYAETPSRALERAEASKVATQEALMLSLQRERRLEDKVFELTDDLEHARDGWASAEGRLDAVSSERDDLLAERDAWTDSSVTFLPEGDLVVWDGIGS